MMTTEAMKLRLQNAFPDADIQVTDLTGTQDHWSVQIATSAFSGKSRIQQHQLVMSLFQEELKTGSVHALQLTTQTKN